MARALKHGPRRSFGKSRHADADPSSSKVAPVTKPKPKPSSKGGSDEKEEKTGGFLFRRRSFNEKKTTSGDNDSYKGSPKVSKKFGLKIGSSGNKKPPIKSKPSTSTGENDSILSEDIPQVNSTTSTPSKTSESKQDGSSSTQNTSTPAKENSTPPSRRERTPGERDSALFKEPTPLFGHRSVLFGSAEFDAIFEKFAKEDEENSKAPEPADNSSEAKQSDVRSTPDRKPTPSKKPEVSTKPNWSSRGSTSSEKSSEQKSTGSRVSEGRALFEKPKSSEEIAPKKPRRGFSQFSKYEDNTRTEAKKVEEKIDEVKEKEKVEEIKDEKMEITKDEGNALSSKSPLFDDDQKAEPMETEKNDVETKSDTKKSLFGKYEAGSDLFKRDDDEDDDELFGVKNKKETGGTAKKLIYGSLFYTEETASTVKRSGSLFDEEPSDDDELFSATKKSQKTDVSVKALDLTESTVESNKAKDAKASSPLADEDESPLFGKPKSPSPDLFSREKEEKEEKDKEPIEDDILMDTNKDKTEDKIKSEEEASSPGLFDKPSSPLFDAKSDVQRSTSIFEGKRSESEEDLFHVDQKGKEPDTSDVKEKDVAGGFLLVDVEKKKEETRSSLFDDEKLCFDDSDVLPKLEKESKENKGQFAIDDFVMVPKQEEVITESITVEDTTSDPLNDEKKEKGDEMALEDFPPKQSTTEDVPQKETSKEHEKEKQSNEVRVDSSKSRIRHGSAEKKRDLTSKDEKKSSDDDKPAWMLEAQRRKERRLLEKEKEKEKKLQATKEKSPRNSTEQSKTSATDVKSKKSNISTTTSVTKKSVVEDDMPEWQKKLMERKQRVAEQKKTMLSSSKETTYTSRRDRAKDTAATTVTTTVSNSNSNSVEEKKKEEDKVEEKEQKETEEEPQSKTADEEKEKSKSPPTSPLPEKPLLSPKPKLDEIKSPTRTTSVSSPKPELKRKPSVEVTISSTKRETRRSSSDQEKDKERNKESLAKELENEAEKSSPSSKRRIPSSSDKKTVSVSSKVSTSVSSTRTSSTSSDTSVPKWKRDLQQQKKTEPEKKDKGSRDAVVSPTSQDGIPEWKRQLLEKRKQRRTPTPTDDKEVSKQITVEYVTQENPFMQSSSTSSKTDKQSIDKPNYRSVLSPRTTQVTSTPSPKTTRKNASNVNKEVPDFMKEFKSKGRSARDSKRLARVIL